MKGHTLRFNTASSVYRSCLGVIIGAAGVGLGAGLGFADVPDPYAAVVMLMSTIVFIVAVCWILA